MKTMFRKLLPCSLLLVVGCSTLDSRIAKHRAEFETWPPAVQEKIIRGELDLGFTRDQVRVALGEPARVWTRTTADGTATIWSYRDRGPRFGFGVGLGFGSGWHGGTVGAFTGTGYSDDESLGVIFGPGDRVTAIEQRNRGR